MRKIYTLLPLLFFLTFSQAQDIHFTQFNMSPLTLNPAHTGAFYGSFRIGAIYRTQYFNVPDFAAFKTPNLLIDAPIIKGFRDKDWVGVGLNIFQDEAGDLELTVGAFMGSVAYHFALDKEGQSVLTLGVQAGFMSRSFANSMAAQTEVMETLPTDSDTRNFFNLNSGLMLRTPLTQMSLLEVGVAGFNLTQPDNVLSNSTTSKYQFRLDAHARLKNYLTETFTLTPTLLYKNMGQASQFAAQVMAGLEIDPEKQIDINAGLGYRFANLSSLELLFGLDWGDFKAGVGYDLGLTSYATGGGPTRPGAVEFAVSYIAKIYKKPEPKPTLFCPRF